MASENTLNLIISTAMPGLPLRHIQEIPEKLSTKPGFIYFKLGQTGEFWDNIKKTGTIAFYFPNQFKNCKVEMLVVRE